jgi:transketolase
MTLQEKISELRIDLIKMGYAAGASGAHMGGSLSLVEVMAALYFEVMQFSAQAPMDPLRDRLIFSKGHGVMAQYAALKQVGLISEEMLLSFKSPSSVLYAHPSMHPELGIEFSSGSLGQGLSLGVGVGLALRLQKNSTSRIFVILGDGECNEGSIWEAAASAAHFKLNNMIAIIDKNDLQYDGKTMDILSMEQMSQKWQSFGWETLEVDGHDVQQLIQALRHPSDKPLAIIAQTIKGRGVSFMENNPQWHNGILTQRLYTQAMAEQGGQHAPV